MSCSVANSGRSPPRITQRGFPVQAAKQVNAPASPLINPASRDRFGHVRGSISRGQFKFTVILADEASVIGLPAITRPSRGMEVLREQIVMLQVNLAAAQKADDWHHAAAVGARGRLSDMEREHHPTAAGTGTLGTAAGRWRGGWMKRASFPWCIHPGGRLT